MSELHFDDAAAKRLLALYTTPDVARTREAFLRALAPQPGEHVLDVGCGPGFLAGLIADAVGPSGAVTGIDVSEPLLAVARSHCANKPWVVLQHGDGSRGVIDPIAKSPERGNQGSPERIGPGH